MATIQHTGTAITRGILKTIWTPLAGTDDGTLESPVRYPDKTVQVTGTFDSATVTMQGSNDGASFFTLKDAQGNDVALSSGGATAASLIENPQYIRPLVSGGGGSTALTVTLVGRS